MRWRRLYIEALSHELKIKAKHEDLVSDSVDAEQRVRVQVSVMTCDLTETLMLQIQDLANACCEQERLKTGLGVLLEAVFSGSASSEPLLFNFVNVFRSSVERKTSHKRKNTALMSLQPRLLFDTVKSS
jgi:hypothetical protein